MYFWLVCMKMVENGFEKYISGPKNLFCSFEKWAPGAVHPSAFIIMVSQDTRNGRQSMQVDYQ